MKYLSGYITAAIFSALTWVLMKFGERFSVVVDMVYPYVVRTSQGMLADWTATVDFCLWQLLAAALLVIFLTSVVLMIIRKWNVIQWFGWVLAVLSVIFLLNTGFYGLNYYAGDLSDDMRMDVARYTMDELTEATVYYRDKANALSEEINRDGQGNPEFASFEELAEQAPQGFHALTYQKLYPIFAGSAVPVKQLGSADFFTSMGVNGITVGLTGEAAVNPQIPDVMLPVTMCKEMSRRMCIATEKDAIFASFLAASHNDSKEFQYSAYLNAYRYCYSALSSLGTQAAVTAADTIRQGVSENVSRDLQNLDLFYTSHRNSFNAGIGNSVKKLFLNLSGDAAGIAPENDVCNLLVNWHIQQVVLPSIEVTETHFDPYDETQVDLSGIVNARENQG